MQTKYKISNEITTQKRSFLYNTHMYIILYIYLTQNSPKQIRIPEDPKKKKQCDSGINHKIDKQYKDFLLIKCKYLQSE